MPIPIKARIIGAEGIQTLLLELEPKLFRKASRKAIGDCTKVILSAARTNVPKRTGSLRKALGRKVVAGKKGEKKIVGIVGPRKDLSEKQFQKQQDEFAAGKRKRAPVKRFRKVVQFNGREITVNPVKYAHLVEFGTAPRAPGGGKKVLSDGTTVFGNHTAGAKPQPFLRPAWEGNISLCESIVRAAWTQAVRKAGKKGNG